MEGGVSEADMESWRATVQTASLTALCGAAGRLWGASSTDNLKKLARRTLLRTAACEDTVLVVHDCHARALLRSVTAHSPNQLLCVGNKLAAACVAGLLCTGECARLMVLLVAARWTQCKHAAHCAFPGQPLVGWRQIQWLHFVPVLRNYLVHAEHARAVRAVSARKDPREKRTLAEATEVHTQVCLPKLLQPMCRHLALHAAEIAQQYGAYQPCTTTWCQLTPCRWLGASFPPPQHHTAR